MRHLIILRCGKVSIHKSWINQAKKLVDIAFVYYDESDFSSDSPTYSEHFTGTKLTGVYDFLTKHPHLVNQYDFFWLFEDDLFLPYASLQGIVDFVNQYKPALSAPSLTFESYYSHPIMFQNPPLLLRGTDFVECMSPIMRRDFLLKSLKQLKEYPVWGIERYWQHLLWEMKEVALIFDKWPITHTRPIRNGSLYKIAHKLSMNIEADEERSRQLYSGKFNRYINTLFGIPDTFKKEFLIGAKLRNFITSGLVELTKMHGEHLIPQILEKTYFKNNLFTQFLSFPTVTNILDMPTLSPEKSNLITGEWLFGNYTTDTCWCDKMQFNINGRIENYSHDNEYAWKTVNETLVFLSKNNKETTIFDTKEIVNGKILFTGKCLGNNSIYYLKEK